MALSDYEKEVLAELEAALFADKSPEAASTHDAVREFAKDTERSTRRTFSPRRIAVGLILAVLGLVGLISAVTIGYSVASVLLGVASFAVSVAGVHYALHRQEIAHHKPAAPKRSGESRMKRFMDGQERRWDERER